MLDFLLYYSLLQSQFGQIAAFRREWQKTDSFFDSALSAFRQHSDQEMVAKDIEQTSIYRAITAMDNPDCPSEEVEKLVTDVIGSWEEAVFSLSVNKGNDCRYKSHLLVRYLLFRPDEKNAALRDLYRNLSSDPYIAEESHPWPLIMLYKAFLLREVDEEAGRHLAEAAAYLVLDPIELPTSPLIRLIGCVCAAVAVKWGSVWTELDGILQGIGTSRPMLAERVQMVNDFLEDKNAEPLQMICQVLPFNFH